MRPAARFEHALTLLAEIEHGITTEGPPAERCVQSFFRKRRYAGSKDRRAISERVYRIIRHRGYLAAALNARALPIVAEMLALADAAAERDSWDLLFDGERYSAARPDEELLDRLTGLTLDNDPVVNLPDWLGASIVARFGDGVRPGLAAMEDRAPIDLRLVAPKQCRDKLVARHDGSQYCRYSPIGVRLAEHPSRIDAVLQGEAEIQDESAQTASLLAGHGIHGKVIDLCAGAGGKSLTLKALNPALSIVAFDVEPRKLDELEKRAERAGISEIDTIVLKDGERATVLDQHRASADLVIIDAPCSGSGTWRRQPDLKWRLTPERLAAHIALQASLLDEAAGLVREGGRLAYMTCSILPDENETQIDRFLGQRAEFTLQDWRGFAGALRQTPPNASTTAKCLQLLPHLTGGDGFFLALLARDDKPARAQAK